MFGFVCGLRGVRGRVVIVVLVVFAVLGGVTAGSVAAARSTTVSWKVSSLTVGQVKRLSAVATSNSPGVKTWSKTGSCRLTPRSRPTRLTMGSTGSCVLTLKIAQSGKFPAKTSMNTITRTSTTTTTIVPATTTTVPVALYSVGDTGPGGGTIFYVDMTRAVGSRYFEVACIGWSDGTCGGSDVTDAQTTWGCNATELSGAGGTAIGTGKQNTIDILAECVTPYSAAYRADIYSNAGQSDWFSPSKDELNELCKWAHGDIVNPGCNDDGLGSLTLSVGGFSDTTYWSSSEIDDNHVWSQYFYDGSRPQQFKGNIASTRPIRAF